MQCSSQCPLWVNSGHAELVGRTAHSPCPRRQVNTAVAIYRKIGAYAVTQSGTPILGKRHAVTRRWCLTTKKWRPVIVKVSENRGDIDCADRHVIDAGTPKERCQWCWMTNRKPVAVVKLRGTRVQGDSSIPEMTHHLHLAGVIPDIRPDSAIATCRSLHFGYRLCLVRDEIYNETRHRRVK